MAISDFTMLAGGVSSPVRAGPTVGGTPFIQSRGAGALAYDAQGRAHIDYLMGYGPLLFGYRIPGHGRIMAAFERGVLFGSTHEAEGTLAARICRLVPSMEQVRFATTGTEAVMGAVRLARAATSRPLIVRFGGNYHGHSDLALLDAGASAQTSDAATSGIPPGTAGEIRILDYNDLPQIEAIFAAEGDRIAAVLIEAVVGNMGLVQPHPGYLERMSEIARAHGSLIICDEVITWLRLGLGGAQGRAGITPDITTIGKILGAGIPIAGFGGRAALMTLLAPNGPVFTGGTHAGNPLAVAVAHEVLTELENRPDHYTAMAALAQRLAQGFREIFAELDLDYTVLQLESIVDFKFRSGRAVKNYHEASEADSSLFARYYHEMRKRGILLPPSQNEVMFLSTEHTTKHVDDTLEAARDSLHVLFRS